jgi:hypothetical protein
MASIYTAFKRGKIRDKRCRTAIYALSGIAGILRAEAELAIDARIAALEERVAGGHDAGIQETS